MSIPQPGKLVRHGTHAPVAAQGAALALSPLAVLHPAQGKAASRRASPVRADNQAGWSKKGWPHAL